MTQKIDLDACFYVDDSGIHGKGLYARVVLEEETYLGTYDGPEINDEDDNAMHVLWVENDDGQWVGRDGQNLLRYLNHNKKPNAEFDGFDLYALRDIGPDEELTIHYGVEFEESLS